MLCTIGASGGVCQDDCSAYDAAGYSGAVICSPAMSGYESVAGASLTGVSIEEPDGETFGLEP